MSVRDGDMSLMPIGSELETTKIKHHKTKDLNVESPGQPILLGPPTNVNVIRNMVNMMRYDMPEVSNMQCKVVQGCPRSH